MTELEKKYYIEHHLQHELRLLFSAVAVWELLRKIDAGFVVNIARDSACVHFRNLIKFFSTKKGANDILVLEFGLNKPFDSEYIKWISIIEEAILHISPRRINPRKLTDNSNDLNDQMENFKVEILRLWEEFTQASPKYEKILREMLVKTDYEVFDDIEKANKHLFFKNKPE